MNLKKPTFLILGLLLLGLTLVALGESREVLSQTPEEPAVEIPFYEEWASSGHADSTAEAFNHWNEEDPPVIPIDCAKCHSTYGYQDFLGVDGTAAGVVDNAAQIGSVITCVACHNEATIIMDSVVMPSGVEITGLGREARCMQCHQGLESTASVNALIAGLDDDTVSDSLRFLNIHYFAAGATLFGTEAKGAYEYEGKTYNGRLVHIESYRNCTQCHTPHGLNIRVKDCSGCHQGVKSEEDLRHIRIYPTDYDGDGDTREGIAGEIATLYEALYVAIQDYAANVVGTGIVYDAQRYPYFFTDTNGNRVADPEEVNFDNRYNTWTPRLLKAAYNYQYVTRDPGAFAHNGQYIIQIPYDTLEDMGKRVSVNMTGMVRP